MAFVDYFLKIDGVDGESCDHKHKGAIDLASWSWGATQTGLSGVGGGGGAGKVSMQDVQCVMRVNKASPKLLLACAIGQHIPQVVLTCRQAGKEQQEYVKWTFSDVLVSSYQTGGSRRGAIEPMDHVSLNFAKIEVEYKEQKADGALGGAVKVGYDLKANKAV